MVEGNLYAMGHDVSLASFSQLAVHGDIKSVGRFTMGAFAVLNATGGGLDGDDLALIGGGECTLPYCDPAFFAADDKVDVFFFASDLRVGSLVRSGAATDADGQETLPMYEGRAAAAAARPARRGGRWRSPANARGWRV